jgi:hypothetical protein
LLEDEGDHRLFAEVETMALKRGSVFLPVKLLISAEENARRIQNRERLERFKSIDPEDAYSSDSLIKINHPNLFELDVTNISALEAAERILDEISLKIANYQLTK